jgi:hypothetical protein
MSLAPLISSQEKARRRRLQTDAMSLQYLSDCSAQAIKYVTHLLRGLQIARLNHQIATSGAASLMCLPDDLLLMIMDMTEYDDGDDESSPHASFPSIVDLKSFTMCNKRLRALGWPSLFQQINLGPSWSPERMVSSLQLLQRTEDAQRAARELHVDVWPGPTRAVSSEVLQDLGGMLALCMARMDRLDWISLSTTLHCSDALRTAFTHSGVNFPQVRALTAGFHLDWLIDFCPNLETVSSNDWLPCSAASALPFVQAAGKVSGLRDFAYNAYWDADLLDAVYRAMPQLRSLAVRGGILMRLDALLAALKKFRHLTLLALPDAGMLSGLEAVKRPSSADITSAQEAAVTAIFRELPRLEEVRLGRCFRAWTTTAAITTTNNKKYNNSSNKMQRLDGVSIQWEATVGMAGQSWSRHMQSKCHLELGHLHLEQEVVVEDVNYEDDEDDEETILMSSAHRFLDDDMASMLSGMEDSASIFSRTDTLAY